MGSIRSVHQAESLVFEEMRPSVEKKYSLLNEIGEGTYSKVFLAENSDGEWLAIKKYELKDPSLISFLEQMGMQGRDFVKELAEKELKIGQLADHPHIVKVKEAWFEGSIAYVVMEYIDGKPFDITDSYSKGDRVIFVKQLLSAIKHLLSVNVIVDDLWSENILISKGNLVLIDLGGNDFIDSMDTNFRLKHYLNKIERMVIDLDPDMQRVVDHCSPLIPQERREERINYSHVSLLIRWVESLEGKTCDAIPSCVDFSLG